ncbi:efflux transporter outer membrane subunit [Burkholderia sp. 3C]
MNRFMTRLPRGVLAASSLCLTMSACTLFHPLGPDYRAPAAPAAAQRALPGVPAAASGADVAPASGAQAATPPALGRTAAGVPQADPATLYTPATVPDDWWKLYADPDLNALVEEALRANLDLRQAASTLAAAQTALDQARAAWLPSTSVSASYARERNNVYGASGLHRFNAAGINLGVSYEVDLFGRIRRAVEEASASYDAQTFAFAAAQIKLVVNTVDGYLLACQGNAALANARDQLGIADRQYQLVERLHAHGAAADVDVLQAKAQQQAQAATIPNLEANRQAALYSLAVLLGRAPSDVPPAAERCTAPPRIAHTLPVGDGLSLLRRRPDVAEAERQLAAQTAGIGVAMAALYPQVSLGIGVGGKGATVAGAFQSSGRTWQLGPLLQWNFPNVEVALAQARGQQANARAALSHYDSTVLVAVKETDTALDAYAHALEYDAALADTEQTDVALLAETERLYKHGAVAYLNLLDAQRSLVSVRAQRVSAQAGVSRAQVALFQALGGGWSDSAARASEADRVARERFDAQMKGTAAR